MLFFLLPLVGCTAPGFRPSTDLPDVLVIVADTLRADRVGVYGYHRETTPNLDRFATRGVVFDRVTASASWTVPSHVSLFTGRLPSQHGVHRPLRRERELPNDLAFQLGRLPLLGEEHRTLAEELGDVGYRTVMMTSNPWLRGESTARGFAVVGGIGNNDEGTVHFAVEQMSHEAPSYLFVNLTSAHSPYLLMGASDCPWVDEELRSWLERRAEPAEWARPLVPADDPPRLDLGGIVNVPPGVGPPELERISAMYDCGVRGADHYIGRLIDAWRSHGRRGLIVVTSDHGEYLGEHGLLQHPSAVWDEGLTVPMIASGPGLVAGTRRELPVSSRDLAATVLFAVGLPWTDLAPDSHPVQLATVENVRVAESYPGLEPGFESAWQRAELEGQKLIRRTCSDDECVELTRVLDGDAPFREGELGGALPDLGEPGGAWDGGLGPESLEALRTLGYVE